MDVAVTEGEAGFDLPEWPALLAQDPYRHVFATPEWSRAWWGEFGAGRRLLVLTFLDPGPVGLAPLVLDPAGPDCPACLTFLGGEDLTDYMGPISAGHERQSAIAEALLNYAVQEIPDWTKLDARCLPVPFQFAEWLVEAADRLSLPFVIDEHEMTAVMSLPDTFDAYLEQIGKHRRHELRRKLRRFEEATPGSVLVNSDPAGLEKDLQVFFAMHRGSEGEKGHFMGPERETFFTRIARILEPHGMLSLDFLRTAGGEPLATTFSFPYEGSFYLYNSAFRAGAGGISPGISPGIVLVARLIERSIAAGMKRFDFLRGTERYKFELGAERLPLHAVQITRPGKH